MAQSGYTPIKLYLSTTPAAVPTAGNLEPGELALNNADGKLFYEDSAGVVQVLATKAGASGTVTSVGGTGTVNGISLSGTVTSSGNLTLGGALTGVNLATQVTGTLPAANGGTGLTSPGTSGNILTSNGSAWTSAAPAPGGIDYVVKTANYTTQNNEGVLANTSAGAFTVTLPATPAVGDQCIIADSGSAFGTNNLTVGRNGSTIGGLAENLILDITGVSVQLIYDGSTWEVYAQIGGNGGTAVTLTGVQTLTNKTINGANNTLTNVSLTTAVTGTLPVANGGTGAATLTANNVLLGNGTSALQVVAPSTSGNVLTSNGTSWTSAAPPSSAVNYPQNIQTANYTLVLGDAGKQIYHPASDANVRTFTIPSNASVAFPIGTVVLFVAENGGKNIKVAINSDTLVTTEGLTGTKVVPPSNVLTCIKTTSTKWICYLANDIFTSIQQIAISHSNTPFISVYGWSANGFGPKYSDPTTLPDGTAGVGVAFSSSGNDIAVGSNGSPFITAYPFSITGFGTKYVNPASPPPGTVNDVAFSPSGNDIAVAHQTTPYITAYPWSGSGFGTKYSDPATLPSSSSGNGVAFSPSGNDLAVAGAGSTPRITVYPWSGSGFGTKYANPATIPTGNGNGVAFSPDGSAIAVAHQTTPFITAYPWSGSGFGTKYANPATLPTGTGNEVAFSPDGANIAVAHSTTPFISAYPWSGSGFGTKYSDPATLPTGNGNGVAFNLDGSSIAVAHDSTPFITAYPWSGSGFGTKYANPATLPLGDGQGVAFNSF